MRTRCSRLYLAFLASFLRLLSTAATPPMRKLHIGSKAQEKLLQAFAQYALLAKLEVACMQH